MDEVKKVSDLMIPLSMYPVVYDTDGIKEATKVFRRHLRKSGKEYRAVLVFSKTEKIDGEERLVGILRVRDIMNVIKMNAAREEVNPKPFGNSWAFFYKAPQEEPITKVADALLPLKNFGVGPDQTVDEALDIMIENGLNMLLVFDGKKAVGVIRVFDLLKYLTDLLEDDDE
ncbi:HPP family protein [Desulfofalx alkaliphila]|uniref:CBS domain-containing protein n=1 Tax=Desulfofalx alkaliphila TaxID=105483 RepID=UPI0004E238C5|nr:CBS domain-containing protein [Desulfofalx alkaliphila]